MQPITCFPESFFQFLDLKSLDEPQDVIYEDAREATQLMTISWQIANNTEGGGWIECKGSEQNPV